ncbi:MFS transporter [Vulcanisaeta distributa]|uniref:Major facilitator superfamily MFS_1 n=1 Tax=Vulcanisaeta distributa (strain DSM 14429 / JCM 11212 / NBRC 100878 / IC-017) TaxID=572478 RepID=E1QUV0_VULDI|nr:MFS transporter [Vulcanisaeta distributa]ADN49953.1 major facilitator superfamily MFS_1 [Vulcanisaeta distributa DSM 14429]
MRTLAIISTSIGIGFEWYDFFLYSLLGPIIAELFFPSKVAVLSLLLYYLVFLIGFLGRPLGGIIFGHIGDRLGRIYALYFTLLFAGVASLVVAVLPTYYQIGIVAPIILAAMRFLDGVALGGEWGGSFSLTSEYINPNRRGLYSGILQSTVSIASLLISGLTLLLTSILGSTGFKAIGWRILFGIGFIIAILGVFVRLRVEDSPVFKQLQSRGQIVKSPLLEAVKKYWKLILIGLFLVGVFNGIWYYMNYAFSIAYATTIAKEFGKPYVTYVVTQLGIFIVSIIGIFASIFFGYLSDLIGRRPQMLADAVFGIVFAAPYFLMLISGNPALVITALVIGGLFVYYLAGAITPIVLVEMFPPQVRYTGISMAYQIGVGFLGGSAPLIMTYLIAATHNIYSPIYFMIGTGVLVLAMALLVGETKGRLYMGEEVLKQQ